jgi:hypothetical protein
VVAKAAQPGEMISPISAGGGFTRTSIGAKYQNERNAFSVFAVDPRRYLDMYPEFAIAHDQREAFITTRTGAGRRLVERFGGAKVGERQKTVSWV